MDSSQFTPVHWLNHWSETTPDKIFLEQPVDRTYQTHTWAQIKTKVEHIASSLFQLGLKRGDKVAILSKNCAEWLITDLAIMRAGMVSVPIYPSANADTIQYVLEHSEAKAAFIGKLDDWKLAEPGVVGSIIRVDMGYPTMPCQYNWAQLDNFGSPIPEHLPQMDDLMSIIYTSGSTGNPKGAMIKFSAYAWASDRIVDFLGFDENERFLSYLPLAHITERCLVEGAAYRSNMKLYFTESLEHFVADLQYAKPTVFFSVPRLWSLFQKNVIDKIGNTKLNVLLSIPVVKNLIKKKIQKALGLEHVRLAASGSAPISPAIIRWYQRIGIDICEAWGMTENCIYALGNFPFNEKMIGSVGPVLDGCEIKTTDEDELLFRSPGLFSGYYKNEEATKASFDKDGFFKTGDLAKIGPLGEVKLIGRVKDNFKSAKGKFVSPVPIEKMLAQDTHIELLCVIGAGMSAPVCLVQLSEGASQLPREQVRRALKDTLTSVNRQLESHEVIGAMVVVSESWTTENDVLTPTLKIKRHVLHERFNELVDELKGNQVLWQDELSAK